MSRYVDKLFWIVMTIIVLVIAFLSYVTFFYQTSPVQMTADENILAAKQKEAKQIENLYICADGATIMSLPSESGNAIQSAAKGDSIAIRGEEADWLEVALADDKTGWIEKNMSATSHQTPLKKRKKAKRSRNR